MREADHAIFLDRCTYYIEELNKRSHFVSGEVLQGPQNTATLRSQSGKLSVIAGTYMEMKDQFDAFILLEAKDFNHAIQLISKHPSYKWVECGRLDQRFVKIK